MIDGLIIGTASAIAIAPRLKPSVAVWYNYGASMIGESPDSERQIACGAGCSAEVDMRGY